MRSPPPGQAPNQPRHTGFAFSSRQNARARENFHFFSANPANIENKRNSAARQRLSAAMQNLPDAVNRGDGPPANRQEAAHENETAGAPHDLATRLDQIADLDRGNEMGVEL